VFYPVQTAKPVQMNSRLKIAPSVSETDNNKIHIIQNIKQVCQHAAIATWLHDTGHSGYWIVVNFVVVVGDPVAG
jgi:hypothetical protein